MPEQKLVSLKKYVLYLLGHYKDKNNYKYQKIMSVISPRDLAKEDDASYILNSLVSYIFKVTMATYEKKHLKPTDLHILEIINSDFVINNAYDYILYLQNAHEELEYEELNISRK